MTDDSLLLKSLHDFVTELDKFHDERASEKYSIAEQIAFQDIILNTNNLVSLVSLLVKCQEHSKETANG